MSVCLTLWDHLGLSMHLSVSQSTPIKGHGLQEGSDWNQRFSAKAEKCVNQFVKKLEQASVWPGHLCLQTSLTAPHPQKNCPFLVHHCRSWNSNSLHSKITKPFSDTRGKKLLQELPNQGCEKGTRLFVCLSPV